MPTRAARRHIAELCDAWTALIGATGIVSDPEKAPETLWLLGKEYRLEDVYEALRDLVREFSEVLEVKPGEWREDA